MTGKEAKWKTKQRQKRHTHNERQLPYGIQIVIVTAVELNFKLPPNPGKNHQISEITLNENVIIKILKQKREEVTEENKRLIIENN